MRVKSYAMAGLGRISIRAASGSRAARFETITWYAPDARIVDRSREFRCDQSPDAPLDLDLDQDHPTVFLLLGTYLGVVDELRARYPDAQFDQQERGGEILYRAVRPRDQQPIADRR
jgi:hypothetical protein